MACSTKIERAEIQPQAFSEQTVLKTCDRAERRDDTAQLKSTLLLQGEMT